MIQLTEKECRSIYEMIDMLSGGNAINGFAWDGMDDPNDPDLIALAKLFVGAGKPVPECFKE